MIGRQKEREILQQTLESGRPEFVVIYGRRRIGKTYLIKEYFKNKFSFYATGVATAKTHEQLKTFNKALIQYGCEEKVAPKDWLEAFSRLRKLLENSNVLRDSASRRRVIFLDEMPWMDTARSDFKMALEYFWNSWASSEKDLVLIACGSATSWIINNLLMGTGGFYNRVTRQIHLSPFNLGECEKLIQENGLIMTRKQIIDSYMIFGGVPLYYNLLDNRLSLLQNIDDLYYSETGQLHYEFESLFSSIFKNADKHYAIIDELAKNKNGTTRVELSKAKAIGDGEPLTKALLELEQCGFIRKYKNFTKEKSGYFYQITDPFILFCIKNKSSEKINSWSSFYKSPSFYNWRGNSFEIVCLNHTNQIKDALKVLGVESSEYSWRSKNSSPGAQIDLLIDRMDGVINLCEMKYTDDEYEISEKDAKNLINKRETFIKETNVKKAIYITLASVSGLKRNAYYHTVQNVITGDDLFM